MVTRHVAVPEHPSPDQPVNVEPESGAALNVTLVPSLYMALHCGPQLIPLPADVTDPVPVPFLLAVSLYRAITRVGSLAVSLLVTTSPPPDTDAVFVTEEGAVADTLTVTVIAG